MIEYDYVDWKHFDLTTGEEIKNGRQYIGGNTNRLQGPGVNNALINRLKKGESITLEFPELNLKAVFTPRGSAW